MNNNPSQFSNNQINLKERSKVKIENAKNEKINNYIEQPMKINQSTQNQSRHYHSQSYDKTREFRKTDQMFDYVNLQSGTPKDLKNYRNFSLNKEQSKVDQNIRRSYDQMGNMGNNILMNQSAADQFQRKDNNIPVIMISAKGQDEDKILGLDLGADDYIVKPFNPLEAMARINSNIRRFYSLGSRAKEVKSLQVKNLRLDTEQCIVYRDDEAIANMEKMVHGDVQTMKQVNIELDRQDEKLQNANKDLTEIDLGNFIILKTIFIIIHIIKNKLKPIIKFQLHTQ